MKNLKESLESTLKQIQDVCNSENGMSGIPSGLKDLDRVLCGFNNSDLIVIGGRPCMGKTALMISLALNIAEQGIPVLFYSYEMSETQLVRRILTNRAKIESYKIERGSLAGEDWERMLHASNNVSGFPLFIGNCESSKIEEFCRQIAADVESTQAKIVFIDYVQLLTSAEKYQNRYEEVAACTRILKNLARQLNIPIIVGSQINRNPEHRSQGHISFYKPHMSDLRDSGTICEDANVVLLLDRPEIHLNRFEDADGNNIKGALEVNIAKNHMGPQDIVRLKFLPEFCRIEDWSTENCFGDFEIQNRPSHYSYSDDSENTTSPF